MRSLVFVTALGACATSTHPTTSAALGQPSSSAALLAVLDAPGPLLVETVASADWAIDRAGLINLEHPRAVAAGLTDGDEPIQIYFHVIRHPKRGTYLVDTGVEQALRDDPERAAIRGLAASAMKADTMVFHAPLADFLAKQTKPLSGVFLTHLHLDHVTGLPDVPRDVPVFLGPGETHATALMNLFVQGIVDEILDGRPPLQEWQFGARTGETFEGVIDVFGDGSLWALWVPGHTSGSTAYLARTTTGPVLLVGDACHTAWGWEHDVEPGTFSTHPKESVASLTRLRRLVAEHPGIDVRLGHQALPASEP